MPKTEIIKKITYGVCEKTTDFLLWYIYYLGASFGKYDSRGMYEAFREADKELEELNFQTIRSALQKLTKKNIISYKKREGLYHPEITRFGKNLLQQIIPAYFTKRPWDHRIYLITYDIPERSHYKRDIFRLLLYKAKCRCLQESTWLTPYNPREIINAFVREKNIPGNIIVSDVGTDGGIGESSIQDLIVNVYQLEKLNRQYQEFIDHIHNKSLPSRQLIFEYLAILKDDPQLPFELLPSGWLGDKASFLYKKLETSLMKRSQRP